LRGGETCKFTASELPPDASWPPDWNKPALKGCRAAFKDPGLEPDPRGVAFGGCYMFSEFVIKIEVDFSIDISCGCDLERSKGKLALKGEF